MIKRLIFDLDTNTEVTVFYLDTQVSKQVQKVYLYTRGKEYKFTSNVVGETIDEIKEQVISEIKRKM